jgi:hypothetical protein
MALSAPHLGADHDGTSIGYTPNPSRSLKDQVREKARELFTAGRLGTYIK